MHVNFFGTHEKIKSRKRDLEIRQKKKYCPIFNFEETYQITIA